MNNCRAGLYGFTSTTTWLHETGMASPPVLVVLGLTLPDSRLLSGIAGIGLTLANIAIVLPHLRQPLLDILHAHECALALGQSTEAPTDSSLSGSDVTQPDVRDEEGPILVSVPSCDKEHESPPLARSATVKYICSPVAEPLECANVDLEVSPQTMLPLPVGETDDSQTAHLPDADSSEKHVSSGGPFLREGRCALYIPLPVPDALEIAFFDAADATLSDHELEGELSVAACEPYTALEEYLAIEEDEPVVEEGTEQVSVNLSSPPEQVETGQNLSDLVTHFENEDVIPISVEVAAGDHRSSAAQGTATHVADSCGTHGDVVRTDEARSSSVGGTEVIAKRRPESLAFIPQSVIRRYPSVPRPSAGHHFGHASGTFNSGAAPQVTTVSPHILIHNPSVLLDGAEPSTTEGGWRTSFLPESRPKRPLMIGQTFVIETASMRRSNPLEQGLTSGPQLPVIHAPIPLTRHPISTRRRLGVLSRAALRDRRSAARRRRNDEIDDSSTSDSDSEFSDSQLSNGSSADESMLPHILGADLIAAIDANSESELNLVETKKTMCNPFDVYEDSNFLVSEDSAADVSMVMHLSTKDDASNDEVRAPVNFRSFTYEDIQQWASGVVQKCVRQICRSQIPVEPSSPSQASDVCAERPSGLGISQCPLSGLHCKLGAAASTEVPAPKALGSLPPTSIGSTQKPLHGRRNLRDIPEFVPRQRYVSVITQGPQRLGTRSTCSMARDAATEVIARMESRVGFHTRQHFEGVDRRRMASTAGA